MRTLSNDELQKVRNQREMLDGCLNRMCVTKDKDESKIMYESAINRISNIWEICTERFIEEAESEVGK